MSASERLKALDANLHPAPWDELWVALNPPDDPEYLIPLRNALPQIVAVVEAAENVYGRDYPEDGAALGAALTALEEALS